MRFPGFIGPSYTLQSVNVDCQNCVNLYPEINALGTGKEREVAALVPTPGLRTLVELGDSPIRGEWTASNGQFFVVAGQKLFRVSSSWVATELGLLNTDTGPVSMADNGTHLVIVDNPDAYAWNMDTSVFAEITDEDFPGAVQVTFQDGYFIFVKPDSQQFFISDLNSIDFDPLDIASAEGSPDFLVGLKSCNQNVFLFGPNSVEAFFNSGNADFPFERIQGAVIDVGCSAAFSIQKIGGSLYWLGGDSTGTGVVYRMNGFQPERISTHAIESVIRGLTLEQISAATAWSYQQGGHPFYCLNIPGLKSTWVYDASNGFWHERQWLSLWSLERHRAECHAVAHGLNVVGDYENGKLYALDPEVYSDDGNSIVRIRTAPHISKNLKYVRHNSFQLDMETGVGTSGTGQGVNPQVMLQWSDDGGHTFSNEYWKPAGKIGERKTRVIWRRLGSSRDRVYRITMTDPVKPVFIGAEVEMEEGVA